VPNKKKKKKNINNTNTNININKKIEEELAAITENINTISETAEPVPAIIKSKTKKNTEPENKTIFFDSLNGMTQNDIVLNAAAKDVKKESFDFARYFVLFICLIVFIYAAYEIAGRITSYINAAREYDALKSLFYGDTNELASDAQFLKQTKANAPIQDIITLQKYTGRQVIEADVSSGVRDIDKRSIGDIQRLKDINPDFYGWIKVEHTNISYPIVQTTDNDYYLHYSFEKKRYNSGAIFCDYRNSRNVEENRNTIIYGHNMLDSSMFQPLLDYGNNINYFKDGIIELTTEKGIYYYEIFSVRDDDPKSGYIQTDFESDEQYVAFLQDMEARSYFHKNVTLDKDSKIITLSTCINQYWIDWRFVVQGVLIDVK